MKNGQLALKKEVDRKALADFSEGVGDDCLPVIDLLLSIENKTADLKDNTTLSTEFSQNIENKNEEKFEKLGMVQK